MSKGNKYRRKNPVARVLNQINRPQTHRSAKDYRRVNLNVRDFAHG